MTHRRSSILAPVAALAALAAPCVGLPQAEADQAPAIERLVDDWYAEQCAGERGRPYRLMAPGGIDASPGYRYRNDGSAALGPRYYLSLAATALLFRYEITQVRADTRFARVGVRERGYRYASAAGKTYEVMSDTLLVVERQENGRWLVLAHQTNSTGFSSSLATNPLPDLGPDGGQPEARCAPFKRDEFG